MNALRSLRGFAALTRVFALSLFLIGTNYCLVNALPGSKGCGMTVAANASATTSSSCSACPSSKSQAPAKSKRASGTLPCCTSYAPVESPGLNVHAAKTPSSMLLALLLAPPAQPAPRSTRDKVRAWQSTPQQRTDLPPPSGRAPPIL